VEDLHAILKRYWGYETFRPHQEQVVRSLIAGRDVAVVMPTGGGKSLCYQLPAVVSGRTGIVVSPLISLMQDQVAQLREMGIPAGVLNSSMTAAEQTVVRRQAQAGEFRLLYLSPERLARADTADWLARLPLAFFVVDEAHCISEWGHEFRPEYRNLKALRDYFPETPIAAFTASATRRVRADILHQLGLRDPQKTILSFHRPNLRYLVRLCNKEDQPVMLMSALQAALDADSSGVAIVYASTIATVESTVAMLGRRGIKAVPYHGKMNAEDRRDNQEAWMADEVRVLVGTLAFGLGINKPSVRAVIHLALPKSIEQYYQEAGRAGRDGQLADCVLLWQKKDAALLAHFVDSTTDPDEKERGWQRYHEVRGFAEKPVCRHKRICLHFGETPKWDDCGMCDVCGPVPEWFSAPVPVATTPSPVATPRPTPKPAVAVATPGPINTGLREMLRAWRREVSTAKHLPAYIVLHDTTIDEISRLQPTSEFELLQCSGIGKRKAETYGEEILAIVKKGRG
jgi:ATP-dependent DNA helicase RecQ